MAAFTILILVCSVALSRADCHPKTAVDVVRGPTVKSEIMCGLFGQTQLASTALAPKPGSEYTKIMCMRH